MPAQKCLWTDEEMPAAFGRATSRQSSEECAIGRTKRRSLHLAPEHCYFVTQDGLCTQTTPCTNSHLPAQKVGVGAPLRWGLASRCWGWCLWYRNRKTSLGFCQRRTGWGRQNTDIYIAPKNEFQQGSAN
jgi:hypothetical protein